MSRCAHCGGGITAFDIVSRTRTARYHEDCRTRELGLPYEPWLPIRVVLFVWDGVRFIWDGLGIILRESKKELRNPLGNASNQSERERADDAAMKHRDPWL